MMPEMNLRTAWSRTETSSTIGQELAQCPAATGQCEPHCGVGLLHRRIHHTDQPAGAAAGSEVERGEEPERVVGESDLFEAEGGPELKHLVEGNAEDEFDVGLCGFIEQRRQNESNASGSVAER
jgi:hypothetical protein